MSRPSVNRLWHDFYSIETGDSIANLQNLFCEIQITYILSPYPLNGKNGPDAPADSLDHEAQRARMVSERDS